ncbi:HD domain-containing protein [Actinomadura decatromicini]|uniref:Bifunctional (P)ppGpp synthetase/guanosine-3',5'-bis(Diphosphate) 3'-pyrophosphohydrolase n=1 Tax=Actinomadura decatromicini TaxID=2604572 RepID=A0A5D3FZ99_9ACTN|nr:HD domain-containing protein [Actinomadura decatromicini]TYK53514.1 bifunctional (p)ppGpp synthetase/guanosine-3',5'-bis(diphosphate) 3'-pyrophosphohydrolase [Actinomadura decatromicini]
MEVFTHWRTWDEARAALVGTEIDLDIDVDAVGRAAEAAERWHGDQRRPTGAPYVEHLLEALEVLVSGPRVTDTAVLSAALLHDVVEDTSATLADVEAEFGPVVTELVDWVTKPPAGGAGRQAKRAAKAAYLRRLRDAPREAVLVKLADRVSNVQTLDRMPPDFQRRYYAETVTYIVPLAEAEPWFADWYAEWRRSFAHLK